MRTVYIHIQNLTLGKAFKRQNIEHTTTNNNNKKLGKLSVPKIKASIQQKSYNR